MKLLIPLIFVFSLSVNIFAQNSPKVIYKQKRINSITGLNAGLKKDFTCKLYSYSGSIRSLVFAEETDVEPIAIILNFSNGTREQFGLDDEIQYLSESNKSNIKSQLIKKAKVKVRAFSCGAGGRSDKQLFSIDFL